MLKVYSYQDCWNYFLSILPKNVNLNEDKQRNLISLCQTTPANFWLSFLDKALSSTNYRQICRKIQQYQKKSIPVAYLKKETYFYNLPFKIEKGVFIPQKDTEILLEKTLELVNKFWDKEKKLKVLDIGTGCGNLAICLAKTNSHWQITAIDISKKSLKIVKKNVIFHQVKNVKVKKSNLFNNLKGKYNVIITNPPYISKKEYNNLHPFTKKQPKKALVAKNDGYWFYQQIIQQIQQNSTKKFLAVMEIGYQQKEKITKMITEKFSKVEIEVFSDSSQNDRVIAFYHA